MALTSVTPSLNTNDVLYKEIRKFESATYSPDIFSRINNLMSNTTKAVTIIKEFEKYPKIGGMPFTIKSSEDGVVKETTFLHVACKHGLVKVATWIAINFPKLVNYNSRDLGTPLNFLIKKVPDILGFRIVHMLLNHPAIRFYDVIKNCIDSFRDDFSESGELFQSEIIELQHRDPEAFDPKNGELTDKVIKKWKGDDRSTKDIAFNRKTARYNLIFGAAFRGKPLMFEQMLGFYSKPERTAVNLIISKVTFLPIDLVHIVDSYNPFILSERVKYVTALNCELAFKQNYLVYITPLQQVLNGIIKKNHLKSFVGHLQMIKLLFSCVEDLESYPVSKFRGNRVFPITFEYKSRLPNRFFERLKTENIEVLNRELLLFFAQKRAFKGRSC